MSVVPVTTGAVVVTAHVDVLAAVAARLLVNVQLTRTVSDPMTIDVASTFQSLRGGGRQSKVGRTDQKGL